jgi:hypothetical protein
MDDFKRDAPDQAWAPCPASLTIANLSSIDLERLRNLSPALASLGLHHVISLQAG